MNIETICKVINKHPELQALYAERQNYPFFANTIDNLISNKFVDEEQLTYYLLWCIANLSVDTSIGLRMINMYVANDPYLSKLISESTSKTYFAEMRNLGLTKGLEDFYNAQSNGHRSSEEGDQNGW